MRRALEPASFSLGANGSSLFGHGDPTLAPAYLTGMKSFLAVGKARGVELAGAEMRSLEAFWRVHDPEYRSLLARYDVDVGNGCTVPLSRWLPVDGSPLTESELCMRMGVSSRYSVPLQLAACLPCCLLVAPCLLLCCFSLLLLCLCQRRQVHWVLAEQRAVSEPAVASRQTV
jgi:hypothetical protein